MLYRVMTPWQLGGAVSKENNSAIFIEITTRGHHTEDNHNTGAIFLAINYPITRRIVYSKP
jgi:hypothetical protein